MLPSSLRHAIWKCCNEGASRDSERIQAAAQEAEAAILAYGEEARRRERARADRAIDTMKPADLECGCTHASRDAAILCAVRKRIRPSHSPVEGDAAKTQRPVHFFDKRAADALASEVKTLIERRVIDSRSPAADALLDYLDGWDRGALADPKAGRPSPVEGDGARVGVCPKCKRPDCLYPFHAYCIRYGYGAAPSEPESGGTTP